MGLVSGFLNMWTWRPGGFIWKDEEKSQEYTVQHNMRTIANSYAYFLATHVDGIGGDDRRRGGTPYWIWKDWVVGRDQRHQYESGYVNEGPTLQLEPNMSQLTTALHQSVMNVWEQIADQSAAGEWGAPP